MNLNEIHLTAQLVATLYEHTLIESDAGPATERTQPLPDIRKARHLGNFDRQVLVIVNNGGVAFIEDQELQFFTNVLTACRLGLADIAIVNINGLQPNEPSLLIGEMAPRHVILFGVLPLDIDLPMNFPEFQVQQFNKCTYLHAPALKTIERDKQLKARLWASLKQLFGL